MNEQDLPEIMQCQRCGLSATVSYAGYTGEAYVICKGECNIGSADFKSSNFTIDDEKLDDDMPILMAKQAAINDWNDIQELIRKGKMYDELKALVEATERTTKIRSL